MARDQKILEAATKLFRERGFTATTVNDIGELAGITGPAIYRHFSGKDEILSEILNSTLDRFMQIPDVAGDADARLRHLVRAHAELVLKDQMRASIYVRENPFLSEKYHKRLRRRQLEYASRWISVMAERFPGRDANDHRARAFLTIGMINGVIHARSAIGDPDNLLERLVSVACYGLYGPDDCWDAEMPPVVTAEA